MNQGATKQTLPSRVLGESGAATPAGKTSVGTGNADGTF